MRHDIDKILLGFAPEQHEKYLSLLIKAQENTISLDFDISDALPCTPPCDKIVGFIEIIEEVANGVLSARKAKDSFFSSTLTKGELEALAELYYRSVMKISATSTELSTLSLELVKNVRIAEVQYREKVKEYQNFLPYLAALYNIPSYEEKINELDSSLYKNVGNALSIMKNSLNMTQALEKICETIVPDFLAKSGRALGMPPYDDFSPTDFYSGIGAFIEQLKNEKRAFFV